MPFLFLYQQGTVTNIVEYSGVKYIEHRYTTVGEFSFTPPFDNLDIDYLIVAGGGGGGSRHSGGGGGGGVIMAFNSRISSGTYKVVVGNGGDGGYDTNGANGGDSYFWNETAVGGGGSLVTESSSGSNGGCGGGGHYGNSAGGISNRTMSLRGIAYGNKGGSDLTLHNCARFRLNAILGVLMVLVLTVGEMV